LVGIPEEKRLIGTLGVDEMVILEWILGKRVGTLDRIHLAQGRDQ
jgi:hypothetical protein